MVEGAQCHIHFHRTGVIVRCFEFDGIEILYWYLNRSIQRLDNIDRTVVIHYLRIGQNIAAAIAYTVELHPGLFRSVRVSAVLVILIAC